MSGISLRLGIGALLLAFGGLLAASLIGAFIAAALTIAYVKLMTFLAGNMNVKIDQCINILVNYILKFLAVLFVGVKALGALAGATFSALLHRIFVSDDIDQACL